MDDYLIVEVSKIKVIFALEYDLASRKLTPEIVLQAGSKKIKINDRYILYSFLKTIDNTMTYNDMHYTLYGLSVAERPSLEDILESYLANAEIDEIGLWLDDDVVMAVNTYTTNSNYVKGMFDLIKGNYLSDYDKSKITYMTNNKKSRRPLLVYTKDSKRVEVFCDNHNTKFVGRYRVGKGWVQPLKPIVHKSWVHLLEADDIRDTIQTIQYSLDNLEVKEIPKHNKYRDRASKLLNFNDRNKLEYDDWLNSFNTSE